MDHDSMYEASPAYRAAYDRYGSAMPPAAACRIAAQHGLASDYDAARAAGELGERAFVPTLAFLAWLGY